MLSNESELECPWPEARHKKGKTLVLSAKQARELFDSISLTTADPEAGELMPVLVGPHNLALIGTMVFSFARVGALGRWT